MTNETYSLLAGLTNCCDDPAAFAELRQQVLQSHFDSVSAEQLSKVVAFQRQIDAMRAVAGTPDRTIKALVGDLAEQCDVLQSIKEYLAALPELRRPVRRGTE